jgi:hypothetical protein
VARGAGLFGHECDVVGEVLCSPKRKAHREVLVKEHRSRKGRRCDVARQGPDDPLRLGGNRVETKAGDGSGHCQQSEGFTPGRFRSPLVSHRRSSRLDSLP